MERVMYFICVALIAYVIGTINFSKIVAWNIKRKDITKMGSGNPGTMNMLRSFGFGMALLAFVGEVLKSGLLCLAFKLIFPEYDQLMYFYTGFFLMIGYNFPIWTKFKGGKGVACFVGVFLFSNLWYVSLSWFIILFIAFIYIDYAFVMSFLCIGGLSIAYTIYLWVCHIPYAWIITSIIWALVLLTVYKHRGNIKRLATGTEKKIGFKNKLKKFFCHKRGEYIIDEEAIEDQKPEGEIVVYPVANEKKKESEEKEPIKVNEEKTEKEDLANETEEASQTETQDEPIKEEGEETLEGGDSEDKIRIEQLLSEDIEEAEDQKGLNEDMLENEIEKPSQDEEEE